jgi:FkbM family methyltransferase
MLRLLAHRAVARGHNPELTLLRHFNQGGMFVDIGANIGDYSRVACLQFSKVLAIEPIPELACQLQRELPGNVEVLRAALSDAPGTATLYIPVAQGVIITGLASLNRDANARAEFREVVVTLLTLDQIHLERVDLIKIDVEGLEESVLRGATGTLQRDWPGLIIEIEERHHTGRTPIIFQMLRDLEYQSYYLRNGRLTPVRGDPSRPGSYNYDEAGEYIVNFIFIHSSRSYSGLDPLIAAGGIRLQHGI